MDDFSSIRFSLSQITLLRNNNWPSPNLMASIRRNNLHRVSVRLPGYRAINSQIFVTSWPRARKQDTRSTRCEIYTRTYRV